jgi:integrase
VPEHDLQLTVAELNPVPRAIVETLLLTGARPSEVLSLRPCDLNRDGRIEVRKGYFVTLGAGLWATQPQKHKTAYKGHKRVILFGPKAQQVLMPFLAGRAPDAFLFSPAEALAIYRAGLRAKRKTRVQPSQRNRRKEVQKRPPGNRYDCPALQHAITAAVERANQKNVAAGGSGVGRWRTYQLRHNAATRLVEEFGWEVARTILGHRSFEMTQVYALDSLRKAADAVGKTG